MKFRPIIILLLLLSVHVSVSAYPRLLDLGQLAVIPGSEMLSIRSVAQDAEGMIWFGTDRSLYSFDGNHMTVRHDSAGNEDHFQINSIICLEDRLLLGCSDGVVMYDMLEESFSPVDFFAGTDVRTLYRESGDDLVWIGTDSGLFKYSVSRDLFSMAPVSNGVTPSNIWSITKSGDYLYVGMLPGLGRYDLSGTNEFELMPENFHSGKVAVSSLMAHEGNRLVLGTSSFLSEVDTGHLHERYVSSFAWIKTICRYGDSALLGTDAGLYLYGLKTGAISKVKSTVVWSMLVDRNENIWFGSDNGLLVWTGHELFVPVDCLPGQTENLYSSIAGNSHGHLFAGGSYGMAVFDDDECTGDSRWYKMEDTDYPISHNKIRKIYHDPVNDDIWACTAAGAVCYNKDTEQFDAIDVNGFTFYNAYDMLVDGDNLWFATLTGLHCVRDGQIVETYDSRNGLAGNRVAQIMMDKDRRLWVRTMDGHVYMLVEQDGTLSYSVKSSPVPKADRIFVDSDDVLWAVDAKHVYRIDPDSPEIVSDEFQLSGNPRKESTAISEADNTLWICFPDGIFLVREQGEARYIYTRNTYSGMYFDESRNRMLLGGLGKIDAIYLGDMDKILKETDSQISVTGLTVNDSYSLRRKELESGKVVLPFNHNNIVVSISNFSYDSENIQSFQYKLDEDDSNWNDVTGPDKSIRLMDLKPGKHLLFLASSGGSEPIAPALTLIIRHPWYATIAAKILYLMLAFILVYSILSAVILRRKVKLERIQKAWEISQAKLKINFFADVAHEFKTPLSVIIAPVSKLLQEIETPEHRRSLQMIHENAMKLNSLIHLSLDYYNDRNDRTNSVVTTTIEVVSFVRSIFHTYKENTPELDFIFSSAYDEIHADVDVVKLETILSNILSNACRYTQEGGTIILTLDYDKNMELLSVRVTDSGVGIPEDELPLVFQRYYQSSRTKDENKNGTGLGLSIVKNYVDLLNGNVTISSGTSGTSVSVSLPLTSMNREEQADVKTIRSDEGKSLIVIVDDNRSVCDFLVQMFEGEYNCLCAYNGKNALKLCQDITPDLIISDVVMPVMDGLEFCRHIREIPSLSLVPVILLTAKDDRETERNSISLNIDAFMPKPFDMDTLKAKAGQLIVRSRKMEEAVRLRVMSEPHKPESLSQNEQLLVNLTRIIEENIDDSDLSVSRLCELCNCSEKQLYRKVKSMTGQTVVDYVRSIRLKRAAQLLQNGNFTVSEVMYSVGFSNSSYFARAFYAQFGKTPKDYLSSYKNIHDVQLNNQKR